jgi:hypothetical protein
MQAVAAASIRIVVMLADAANKLFGPVFRGISGTASARRTSVDPAVPAGHTH